MPSLKMLLPLHEHAFADELTVRASQARQARFTVDAGLPERHLDAHAPERRRRLAEDILERVVGREFLAAQLEVRAQRNGRSVLVAGEHALCRCGSRPGKQEEGERRGSHLAAPIPNIALRTLIRP